MTIKGYLNQPVKVRRSSKPRAKKGSRARKAKLTIALASIAVAFAAILLFAGAKTDGPDSALVSRMRQVAPAQVCTSFGGYPPGSAAQLVNSGTVTGSITCGDGTTFTYVVGDLLRVDHPSQVGTWFFWLAVLLFVAVVIKAKRLARYQDHRDVSGETGKTRLVRRYNSDRALEAGLNEMAKAGWVPEGTSTRKQAYSVLTGVFTSGQIHTVTYVRGS